LQLSAGPVTEKDPGFPIHSFIRPLFTDKSSVFFFLGRLKKKKAEKMPQSVSLLKKKKKS